MRDRWTAAVKSMLVALPVRLRALFYECFSDAISALDRLGGLLLLQDIFLRPVGACEHLRGSWERLFHVFGEDLGSPLRALGNSFYFLFTTLFWVVFWYGPGDVFHIV